jgi:hypothetical protein
MRKSVLFLGFVCSLIFGCAKDAPPAAKKDPAAAAAPAKGTLALGAPIQAGQTVSLGDVAKNPAAFKGKTLTTTGTVTSVCQQMGCWMEIKDEASQAHIKMAGHDFFVPKTAAGRKAKVQATLVPNDDENAECNKEAEGQMGHAVAKLQLEASGIELD